MQVIAGELFIVQDMELWIGL